MKRIKHPEEAINPTVLKPGRRIYVSGNAATPQVLLKQLAADADIRDIELMGVLLLGDIAALFSEATCRRITHRIIFNGKASRDAVNNGWSKYQLMNLSDIPRQLRAHLKPDVALISVNGPDNGGNYSLGTTVEGVQAAIQAVRQQGGIVIAERNTQMPFVLGTTVPADMIDYRIDTDYPLEILGTFLD